MLIWCVLAVLSAPAAAQFAELASLATSFLGPALSGGLGAAGAAGAGAGAASQAVGALGQIGQLYQLAQGALQLTGTGVSVLNKASEGAWFPAVVETAAKGQERLANGQQGGAIGMPGLEAFSMLRPQPAASQIGPEFGEEFKAPNVEDYDIAERATSSEIKQVKVPEVHVSKIEPKAAATPGPSTTHVTLFPPEEENEVTDYHETTDTVHEINGNEHPKKKIHIELPDGPDYEQIITEGENQIEIGSKPHKDDDENLLETASSRRVRVPKQERAVPDLAKLIEALQKSNLNKDEIKDIVAQVTGNVHKETPENTESKFDLTSTVHNISPQEFDNRQRILKASRSINKNIERVNPAHPRFVPDLSTNRLQRGIEGHSDKDNLNIGKVDITATIPTTTIPNFTYAPPTSLNSNSPIPSSFAINPSVPAPPQPQVEGQWYNGQFYPYPPMPVSPQHQWGVAQEKTSSTPAYSTQFSQQSRPNQVVPQQSRNTQIQHVSPPSQQGVPPQFRAQVLQPQVPQPQQYNGNTPVSQNSQITSSLQGSRPVQAPIQSKAQQQWQGPYGYQQQQQLNGQSPYYPQPQLNNHQTPQQVPYVRQQQQLYQPQQGAYGQQQQWQRPPYQQTQAYTGQQQVALYNGQQPYNQVPNNQWPQPGNIPFAQHQRAQTDFNQLPPQQQIHQQQYQNPQQQVQTPLLQPYQNRLQQQVAAQPFYQTQTQPQGQNQQQQAIPAPVKNAATPPKPESAFSEDSFLLRQAKAIKEANEPVISTEIVQRRQPQTAILRRQAFNNAQPQLQTDVDNAELERRRRSHSPLPPGTLLTGTTSTNDLKPPPQTIQSSARVANTGTQFLKIDRNQQLESVIPKHKTPYSIVPQANITASKASRVPEHHNLHFNPSTTFSPKISSLARTAPVVAVVNPDVVTKTRRSSVSSHRKQHHVSRQNDLKIVPALSEPHVTSRPQRRFPTRTARTLALTTPPPVGVAAVGSSFATTQ